MTLGVHQLRHGVIYLKISHVVSYHFFNGTPVGEYVTIPVLYINTFTLRYNQLLLLGSSSDTLKHNYSTMVDQVYLTLIFYLRQQVTEINETWERLKNERFCIFWLVRESHFTVSPFGAYLFSHGNKFRCGKGYIFV